MVRVKNVESYLIYESVLTVDIFVQVFLDRIEQREAWEHQLKKLKYAFYLFMLDVEVEEFKMMRVFKDLDLPSEQREREDKETDEKTTVNQNSQKIGEQLQLFFCSWKDILFLSKKAFAKNFKCFFGRYIYRHYKYFGLVEK